MNAVVSDTSPVNYLILIGEIEVLPRLFGEIIIPHSVIGELRHSKAPKPVADWAANPPDWIRIVEARRIDPGIQLGAGETEAISLALEMGIRTILMDERKGRAAAEARGLIAAGTLNILDVADEAGLLDCEAAVGSLRKTSFRMEASLLSGFLHRIRRRKSAEGR